MSIPGRLRLCRGLSSRSSSVSQCEWLGAPSWPSALVEGHWSPLVSWGIPTFFFYGICGILDGSMISKVKNDWELVGQFWSKKLWALTRAPTICILPTVLLYFFDIFCVVSRWCPAVLWFLVPKVILTSINSRSRPAAIFRCPKFDPSYWLILYSRWTTSW